MKISRPFSYEQLMKQEFGQKSNKKDAEAGFARAPEAGFARAPEAGFARAPEAKNKASKEKELEM